MPALTVIAGPNGSGKSTLTTALDFEGRERLLDPDAIARRLNPANPSSTGIAAGREVLQRVREYLDCRLSFALETTLASRRTLQTMREAKLHDFTVKLIYICLDAPEHNLLRVKERALQGGHDVVDQDVHRRYRRSLANLPDAIQIADQTIVYDNSEDKWRRMLEIQGGSIIWRVAADEPQWVAAIRAALLH